MSERLVGFLGTIVGNDFLFQRVTGFCPVFSPEAAARSCLLALEQYTYPPWITETNSKSNWAGENLMGWKLEAELLLGASSAYFQGQAFSFRKCIHVFYCVYYYRYTHFFLIWGGTPGTVRVFSPESYVHDKSVFLGYPFIWKCGLPLILSYVHIYTLST